MAFRNHYSIGRGKFYFREFEPGTLTPSGNFRRLGNVPDASVTQAFDKIERWDCENGVNVKDGQKNIGRDTSLAFTTDNVSLANLALWFGTGVDTIETEEEADAEEIISGVVLGTFYQLGASPDRLQGARNVSGVSVVTAGGDVLVAGHDYRVHPKHGLLEMLENSALYGGEEIVVTYTVAAGSRRVVLSGGRMAQGQLRFISDNIAGANRDIFWSRVTVAPAGDYTLIGSDWQSVGFSVAILSGSGTPYMTVAEDPDETAFPRIVNLDARVNTTRFKAITVKTAKRSDVLRLALPPGLRWVSYAPANVPSPADPATLKGTWNNFSVIKDGNPATIQMIGTKVFHDGYEAARAAFVPVTITGARSYTFFIDDNPNTDNIGGLSIRVSLVGSD
ncbi:hypothetical protein [Sphingomonas phage Carli]|nr:hypothetical protein [Sphingomonas phage Carli]